MEALSQKDWQQAYSLLSAKSRERTSLEQFRRLAQDYRAGLRFEPSSVHIRACEEQGERAIAHLVLTGRAPSGQRSYKDAVEVIRDRGAWAVVLPANFGRPRK
jgi:hypothetical protein